MRTNEQVSVQRTVSEWDTSYTCDGCGKKIDPDDWDGDYAHELTIWLDQDQCVNFFRQRDYCPDCLEPIWAAISQLIKADPDAERDREYE